jgi:hypothetical protein
MGKGGTKITGQGGYTPKNDRQNVNVIDVQWFKTVRTSVNRVSGKCQEARHCNREASFAFCLLPFFRRTL